MAHWFTSARRRNFCLLLAFAVVFVAFGGLFASAMPEARALSISEIDQQQKDLDKKIKENDAKITATKKQIAAKQNDQELLRQQIANVGTQLADLKTKLDLINEAISQKQDEIEVQTQQINETQDLFEARVHQMYISNVSQTTLSTLFEAKDFSDFLSRMKIMKSISAKDKETIETYMAQKEALEQMKAEFEDQQADLEETKKKAEEQQNSLNGMYSEIKDDLNELEQAEKEYLANQEKQRSQKNALEAEMQKALAALAAAQAYGDGVLKWPVPGYTTVTSPFGWRTLYGQADYHTGIDIGTNRKIGPSITAADAGKVVWVKKVSYGYGWHLLIDHGNGVSTLYAHASKIVVNEGAMVAKGQKVAEVGSTGNSTGPHLHFEVRINNIQKNPLKYVVPGK